MASGPRRYVIDSYEVQDEEWKRQALEGNTHLVCLSDIMRAPKHLCTEFIDFGFGKSLTTPKENTGRLVLALFHYNDCGRTLSV